MARKGEKSKARKSPDKSPRRVGRPTRRRKKSDSESSEEKKSVEPAEVEQGESSESGRMRRSGRRQAEPSTSEPKPQPVEWKEDESFWAKEAEDTNKTETAQGDGGTVWKVQTSNGSGGEIQKLRICRQRPGGAGSDSAESSMSPAKESSPLHKKVLKRESQKSPLVESNVAEIELPPISETVERQDTSEISLPPNQASEEAEPETNSKPTGQKVVEYVYETQPSIATSERSSPPQVNESDLAPAEAKGKQLSPCTERTEEELPPEKETVDEPSPDLNKDKDVENVEEVVLPQNSPVENQSGDPAEVVELISPESPDNKKTESDPVPANEEQDEAAVQSIPSPDEPPATIQQAEPTPTVKADIAADNDKDKAEPVDSKHQESSRPPANLQLKSSAIEVRRKSDGSVKSGGSRRSSVSGPASAHSEYNEPLLEISVNKSPMPEGKEEGEIVDDDKTETTDPKEKRRIITIRTKSDDSITSGKLTVNIQSSLGDSSTPNNISKSGSTPGTPATTAKKHPLITGPEPDDSPAVRRRKLSALATTRTVITSGGTARPVRSIPGEALKAVLLPEAEKKEKEKRPKLIKVKENKLEISGGGELLSPESKLNKVEDVREILKNNRADKKAAAAKESRSSDKSPVKTSPEIKAPTRKVSIGAVPIVEDVKALKASRSKSPVDTKATPILFITNLVRPFTAGQLKELLARTGTIVRNGFFIDKIKSKCFVKYADVEMAIETRHALNGVRWPVSNPKVLKVAYATDKELNVIQDSAEGEIVDDISTPRSGWLSSEQAAVKDKEKRKASGPSTREWDRGKPKSGSDGDVIFVDEYKKEEKFKQAALIDIERNDRMRDHRDKEKTIKEEHARNHSDRDRDRERERERRKRRSTPIEVENSSPPPVRKFKKKDYDAPAKLLDDLFRKTKTSPCLYWLPLSAEQIAVKEETRRKHMAEHERRMAELKKSAQQRRDKERDRDRDRRRK